MKALIYTNEDGDIYKVVDEETGQQIEWEEYDSEGEECKKMI